MGRPERPIDPDAGPVAELAAELRRLRDRAGRPSYRELARRVSFSATVLSEAAGGRSLPTLAVVMGYVRACGGDVAGWEERWRSAADWQRGEPPGGDRPAPYLGLASYGPEHARLFFGRETLTRDVLERLAERRFLAVFGASGSGKSSLLRAGVLAAVSRGDLEATRDWTTILLTPGEQPVTALADRIAALAGIAAEALREHLLTEPAILHTSLVAALPAGTELLLVVDQFEELFSVCRDPRQRDCFVRALLAAVTADGARTRVVLGVRADFYAHCASWPELVVALRDAQVLVGPVDQDQMRDIIVKPAEQAGMTVEGALVATALAESGTEPGNEPGALALVSHALLETWRHSPPGRLTLSAYTDAGGVRHAIAATAERVYTGCTESRRATLRRIFLRLVAVGDDAPDTRRRVPPAELAAGDDPATTATLIETLVQARLVTIDEGSVQLAHEALIRFWPRLADWLAEGRDGLRTQRRLSDAASEWARLGRDPAALYRGTPLAVARTWAERDAGLTGLTPVELEFLNASTTAEESGRTAAARTARRMRRLVTALVILLVAVTAAGAVAGWQRETAVSAEGAALSGQLVAESAALAPVNPDAATLAALAAWQAQPSVAARSALLNTVACCTSTQATLRGDQADVRAVALGAGGKLLAAGGPGGKVHVWETADGRQLAPLSGPAGAIDALAFSPRGDVLAAGSADHSIWLWNPVRGSVVHVLADDTGAIESLAFSPDGRLLASASDDGQILLWDLDSPSVTHPEVLSTARTPARMRAVAFSPNGALLAAAGDDGTVTLWSITGHPSIVATLSGATTPITNLVYSPTGTMIAAEDSGGDVLLWHLNQRSPMVLSRAPGSARGLAFSGGGTFLLVAGGYDRLHVWDTGTGRKITDELYRTPGMVTALAYDPGAGSLALGGPAGAVQFWRQPIPPFTGSTTSGPRLAAIPGTSLVASAGKDGTLRLWNDDGNLTARTILRAAPTALAVSPDGKLLATAGSDGSVTVFSLPALNVVRRLHVPGIPATAVSFSRDGHLLAASGGKTMMVWETATAKLSLDLRSHSGTVNSIGFGAGILAAGTTKGTILVWNTRTGRQTGDGYQGPGPVNAVAFSPDGRLLATAGDEGATTLWDPVRLRRLSALPSDAASVWALAFSADGRTLASGTNNGTIMVWNMPDRTLTATLSTQGAVHTLAFAPGARTLLSDGDSGIIAWDLNPGDVAKQACRTLAGDPGLPQAETLVRNASYPRLCP
ncbi:MAG: hypothetical protein JO345_05830 [Streptosporangiaceae bacterium]|nr:hypothetical protein [Streptosporangiaceae bacterium]